MKRKIISIDEDLCNGCEACVNACHEGAIEMINGKAHLIKDDYCDGLGDCLPKCPVDAIKIIEREASPYDEVAVKARLNKENESSCCSANANVIMNRFNSNLDDSTSKLLSWPVQIKLAPITAPYFNNAKLLIAADCTAYAFNNFHNQFMRNHITLVGCPKLDMVDYSEKLTEILRLNDIKSVDIVRMEVPCCKGMELAIKKALINSGKMIPWSITVISKDGVIIE